MLISNQEIIFMLNVKVEADLEPFEEYEICSDSTTRF